MQLAIMAGAAEADVRMLVRQSGVFDGGAYTLDQAQSRLVHAVWAAEQQRSDDEFRGWACGIVPFQLPCLNSNCQVSRLRGCKMLF